MSECGCGARYRRCGPGDVHWRGYSLSESVAAAARAANDVPPAAVAALPHVDAVRRHVKSAALERLFARRGGRAALVGRQGDAEHRAAAPPRMDRPVVLLHGAARPADALAVDAAAPPALVDAVAAVAGAGAVAGAVNEVHAQ